MGRGRRGLGAGCTLGLPHLLLVEYSGSRPDSECQRPEFSESRGMMGGDTHNTKTDNDATEGRVVVVPGGAAHGPSVMPEGTATHHTRI